MNITKKSKNREILWLGICGSLMLIMLNIVQAEGYTGECRTSEDVINLRQGHWCYVPSSHLRDKAKKPSDWDDYKDGESKCYKSYQAYEGVSHVIEGWSGGAYDTKRDRLIIWGGGHTGYGGNEIYVFDLNSLLWERLTSPSCLTERDRSDDCELERSGYYEDGMPRSRHTYNQIQYLPPPIDLFCSFGGSALFKFARCPTPRVDCFNFETWEWERRVDTPVYRTAAFSAVDPVTGHVWVRGTQNYFDDGSGFAEYDPQNDIWTKRGDLPDETWWIYYKTAAIDLKRRLLVVPGSEEVWIWHIDQPGDLTMEILETSGDQEIVNAKAPGFVYDPISEKFVGWTGGADVYALDMDTLKWTKHTPASTNKVIPTAPPIAGTYGRFRYSPNKNVFMVVNSVDENVYLYRFMDKEIDITPPSPPTGLRVE